MQGTVNVRDVGGLPVGDGRAIRDGVLIRAAHLQYLTPDDVDRLVTDLGVRRIVDLRSDVEVEHMGAGPMHSVEGVTVHNYSLYPSGAQAQLLDQSQQVDDRPEENPVMPWHSEFASGRDPVVQAYLRYLVRRPDSILASLRAIAAPEGGTVVHCAAGKDRTGVVVALALSVAGVAPDVIAADYQATEHQLDAIVEHLSGSGLYNREVSGVHAIPHPDASIMRDVLEAIDQDYGGVLAYLARHGWTDADTAALRARLVG
jgi:protein tyrosine/serine phosphatase